MAATTARRLTLTTPSLGVQQWPDDHCQGTTRIAWVTTGSRGAPRTVIMLPVLAVKDGSDVRWVPPRKLLGELEHAPGSFWSGSDGAPLRRDFRRDALQTVPHAEDSHNDPAAPPATNVADDCGMRWGAHHLLVLLIYDESPGIGAPDDGGAGAESGQDNGQGDDEAPYRQEIAALKSFFRQDYDQRLVTRGLVRLPSPRSATTTHEVVFALASCQYPAGMTDGAPNDHRGPEAPASASLLRLSKLLTPMTPASPSLLILAGDQVYVDATAGLFDPRSRDDRLRIAYQNLLGSPGVQSVFGLLPVAMILDDHELADNWEPGIKIPGVDNESEFLREGKRAYRRFQRMAGPPLRDGRALWYEFRHSGVPFFVADTRTERQTPDGAPRRVDNWRQARIMGHEQWAALHAFLRKHRDQVSFVVSPSMLLPRALGLDREPRLALQCDSWDGFPASMDELLALLCDCGLGRVVFLSGDAHLSNVARVTVSRDGHRATFWSVHSSGLYCPYPFANDSPDNYAWPEVFRFEHPDARTGTPTQYRCDVEQVDWFAGDGFATLALTGGARAPRRLCVRFDRAGSSPPPVDIRI